VDLDASESSDPSQGTATIHGGLLSVLSVCFFLFLGVFPRADFNHLINVYQPVVIAGAASFGVLFGRRADGSTLVRRSVAVALTAVLSVYLGVTGYWYYALVRTMNMEVGGERGGVLVAPPDASSLNQVLRNLEVFGNSEDALLTVPDISMLNFLSKRPMPSAYYNLYEHHISHDGGAAVAAGAEKNGASVAITRLNNFFSDRIGLREYAPVLTEYIDTNFEQRYTIGRSEYLLYTRRAKPVAPERFESVLEDCDQQSEKATVEKHLLFHTLYQTIGVGLNSGEESLTTRCRVKVPSAGGEFVWQLEYSNPAVLRSPTTLMVEVLVESRQGRDRVFSKTYTVKTRNSRMSRFPAPHEYRVDLSDYAGSSINLIMRSTRSGLVVMSNFSRRSFGTKWQHPRIVERSL
jgi:hypothetical protein